MSEDIAGLVEQRAIELLSAATIPSQGAFTRVWRGAGLTPGNAYDKLVSALLSALTQPAQGEEAGDYVQARTIEWEGLEPALSEARLRICRERRKQWDMKDHECDGDGTCAECEIELAEEFETPASKARRSAAMLAARPTPPTGTQPDGQGRVEIKSSDPEYDRFNIKPSPECVAKIEGMERANAVGAVAAKDFLLGSPSTDTSPTPADDREAVERVLGDLRALKAHHAWTRDHLGQPGCEVRKAASEYVDTVDRAILALTLPRSDAQERVKALETACRYIAPYLRWTVSAESPGHHPTMPSAVDEFLNVVGSEALKSQIQHPNLSEKG